MPKATEKPTTTPLRDAPRASDSAPVAGLTFYEGAQKYLDVHARRTSGDFVGAAKLSAALDAQLTGPIQELISTAVSRGTLGIGQRGNPTGAIMQEIARVERVSFSSQQQTVTAVVAAIKASPPVQTPVRSQVTGAVPTERQLRILAVYRRRAAKGGSAPPRDLVADEAKCSKRDVGPDIKALVRLGCLSIDSTGSVSLLG